ncbi:MAG: hypothetical protein AB7H97_09530, partial [Pseudobdellovibrionaceae bacterium]
MAVFYSLIVILAFDNSALANTQEWRKERDQRQVEIATYYRTHPEGAEALLTEANGGGQVPMVMFRLFTELFPEIWGKPQDGYAVAGLGQNVLRPKSVLPLGMAYAPSEEKLNSFLQEPAKFNKVGFNCLACHAGQVQVSTMKVLPLIGAPNTRINNPLFLMAKT